MSPLHFSSSTYRSQASSPYKEIDTLGALPAMRSSENSSPSARLRAGSLTLPQNRNAYSSAFGPSIFSTSWAQRINSQIPSSPAQSSFSKNEDEQTPIKTLDYLGLAETPTPPRNLMASMSSSGPFVPEAVRRDPNRIRSYSVNAKEAYSNDDPYQEEGYMEPSTSSTYAYDVYRQSPSRPRSRTAGVLDSPPSSRTTKYVPMHSHMESTITAADLDGYRRDEQHTSDMMVRSESMMDNYEDQSGVNGYIQSQPTRALWLGNIPSSTPSAALLAMFSPFGTIESARVLTHKSCAFVNFDILESAVIARSTFNGKELFSGAGPVRIGFAKAPSALSSSTPEPYTILDSGNPVSNNVSSSQASQPPSVESMRPELLSLCREYGASEDEMRSISSSIEQSSKMSVVYRDVPVTPEPVVSRKYDAPRLRDIRKRIDNGGWSTEEIDEIAMDMLDEVAELASDYLGNTVVQKLFEFCSFPVRMRMLDRVAPVLSEIGVHKNGTWAAQKIIDTASSPEEMQKIAEALRPFIPALFLDQFGNYVIQCCLKFGSNYNNFIFEGMLSHTWEIAQGRYGARAMRACLESHFTSKAQQRIQAAVITIHSVQLATNSNGALLLTWLLDTCNLPNRFRALAPKLSQHLVHLCNPKLASLTVLKIINQRQEPDARDLLLESLFFSAQDKVLEEILANQAQGPTLILKIITNPYIEGDLRSRMIVETRNVLQRLKLQPANGIKRLMDEVGLSTRGMQTFVPQESVKRGYSPQYSAHGPYTGQQESMASFPRSTNGVDPATLQALGEMSLNNSNYNGGSHQMQQMQYAIMQQNMRMQHQHHQHPQPHQYGYTQHYNDSYINNTTYGENPYAHVQQYPQQYPSPPPNRRR